MSFFIERKPNHYLASIKDKELRTMMMTQIHDWPSMNDIVKGLCELITDLLPAPPDSKCDTLLNHILYEQTLVWHKTLRKERNHKKAFEACFECILVNLSYLFCYLVTNNGRKRQVAWDCFEQPLLHFCIEHDFKVSVRDFEQVDLKVRRDATLLLLHHFTTRQHLRSLGVITYVTEKPMKTELNILFQKGA
ncbi:hypothetical protein [Vibrio owensii]|uniref:hypothetical protein n=1 Tax=Vibrio owensii TaxID=696485 RepID=UPI004067DD17